MIDKIIAILKGNFIKDAGAIVDDLTGSDEEKSIAKNKLTEIVMGLLMQVVDAKKSIIMAEIGKGSWLTTNWRPIIMLMLGWIVFYFYFVSPVFDTPRIVLPDKFWELLKIGIGGYVAGRSLEKIADKVTQNIDIPFLKKKNRGI